MGLSGTGKTTLADLITGIIKADSGSILIDDLSLDQIDHNAWRKLIGYVPQENVLFKESIYSNITLNDPQFTEDDVDNALKKAGAYGFVSKLSEGAKTVIGERGTELSGGQRQRIAIARALIRKPRLLVLDEVTTSLDPDTEAELCNNLVKMLDQMAILAISHQRAMIDVADVLYQFKDGEVFEITDKRE